MEGTGGTADQAARRQALDRLVALLALGADRPHEALVVELVAQASSERHQLVTDAVERVEYLYPGGSIRVSLDRAGDRVRGAVHAFFSALRVTLEVPVGRNRPLAEELDLLQRELRARKALVVLDDVSTVADATPFLPDGGGGALLVVSEQRLNLRGAHVVELGPGQPSDASVLAGYAPDTVDGDDQLGIGRDAAALASLIASRDTAPPLSIGLFGDWGDGKSFFLRAIESRVGTLAAMSREAEAGGIDTAYCSHVKQITFNAWHVADSSLWASLVVRIWEGLVEDDDARAPIVRELTTSKRAIRELESERTAVDLRKTAIEEELGELRERQTSDFAQLRKSRSADPTDDRLEQASGKVRRLSGARGAIGELRTRRDRLLLTALGAILVAAAAVIVLFPQLGDGLGAATTALVAIAGFGAAFWQPISSARDQLRQAREKRDELEREAEAAHSARVQQLNQEIEATQARISGLESARDDAERELQVTQRAIEDVSSGRRPYKFVADRHASDDYSKHLGIMALIRRDFEELSALLADARRDSQTPAGVRGQPLPQIDRVVLYIDDLDRCSAKRVVEVLEAVHMLLAFGLFTVVVAVDTRWLMNSLAHHYSLELEHHGQSANGDGVAVTPQNYLEKIFQIPFAMPPMTAEGYGRLLENVFGPSDEPSSIASTARRAASTEDDAIAESAAPAQTAAPSQPLLLNPATLRVSQPELQFARDLFPLLPSPRTAKRFANTYRLMRASLDPSDLKRLTAGPPGVGVPEFRIAQTLLAMVIGVGPAHLVLDELLHGTAPGLSAAIAEALRPPAVSAADRDRLSDLEGFVSSLESRGDLPHGIDPFRRWAAHVGRYSFTTVKRRAAKAVA